MKKYSKENILKDRERIFYLMVGLQYDINYLNRISESDKRVMNGYENKNLLQALVTLNFKKLPPHIVKKINMFCQKANSGGLEKIFKEPESIPKLPGVKNIYDSDITDYLIPAFEKDLATVIKNGYIIANGVMFTTFVQPALKREKVSDFSEIERRYQPALVESASRLTVALALGIAEEEGTVYTLGQTVFGDIGTSRLVEYGRRGWQREFFFARIKETKIDPIYYFDKENKIVGVVRNYYFDTKNYKVKFLSHQLVNPAVLKEYNRLGCATNLEKELLSEEGVADEEIKAVYHAYATKEELSKRLVR